MSKKEILAECIKEAIELGRPYMKQYAFEDEPTKEEWQLALILFNNRSEEWKKKN